MPWERFDRTAPASGNRLEVTVRKHGDLALSVGAFRALGEPSHVVLLHDMTEGRRMIGLRPSDAEEPNSYAVCVKSQGRPLIVARTFVTYTKIAVDTATTWPATVETDPDDPEKIILVADLGDDGAPATRGQGNRTAPAPGGAAVYRCHEQGCGSEWGSVSLLTQHTRRQHSRRPSQGEQRAVRSAST